eukprot:6158426-Pyramimonas_sp.AAC.1
MIPPRRELPFWLAMVSIPGCMCGCSSDNTTCDRPDVIKTATQHIIEHLSVEPHARPLDTDAIYAALPGLQDLVYGILDQPFHRAPIHRDWEKLASCTR